jgi:hypothetical protein
MGEIWRAITDRREEARQGRRIGAGGAGPPGDRIEEMVAATRRWSRMAEALQESIIDLPCLPSDNEVGIRRRSRRYHS